MKQQQKLFVVSLILLTIFNLAFSPSHRTLLPRLFGVVVVWGCVCVYVCLIFGRRVWEEGGPGGFESLTFAV